MKGFFYFLVLISFFSLSSLASEKCFESKSGYILKQKEITQKEYVCSVEFQEKIFYVSKKCFDQKKSLPCAHGFQEPIKVMEIKGLLGEFGSPGFKICYELKGEPQIFTFKSAISNEVEETNRCLFKNGEWLEIPLLVERYKGKLKNLD